ncbi:outer membrane lipoprotein carrier protein [Candidatus Magnetomoraceae bacterium gMMP-15]
MLGIKISAFLLITIYLYFPVTAIGDSSMQEKTFKPASTFSQLSIDAIMEEVEKRYSLSDFSALFFQESTLKAMEITDTASGFARFKHPGMMLWQYEKPDEQTIITDGINLWIYRPEDNQVMIGKAPSYFGEGKGASFLTDIKILRQSFDIANTNGDKDAPESKGNKIVKLIPKNKNPDFVKLYLCISLKNYDIIQFVSYNAYGDRTRIEFKNLQFYQTLEKSMFQFKIPDGADVVQLDN